MIVVRCLPSFQLFSHTLRRLFTTGYNIYCDILTGVTAMFWTYNKLPGVDIQHLFADYSFCYFLPPTLKLKSSSNTCYVYFLWKPQISSKLDVHALQIWCNGLALGSIWKVISCAIASLPVDFVSFCKDSAAFFQSVLLDIVIWVWIIGPMGSGRLSYFLDLFLHFIGMNHQHHF